MQSTHFMNQSCVTMVMYIYDGRRRACCDPSSENTIRLWLNEVNVFIRTQLSTAMDTRVYRLPEFISYHFLNWPETRIYRRRSWAQFSIQRVRWIGSYSIRWRARRLLVFTQISARTHTHTLPLAKWSGPTKLYVRMLKLMHCKEFSVVSQPAISASYDELFIFLLFIDKSTNPYVCKYQYTAACRSMKKHKRTRIRISWLSSFLISNWPRFIWFVLLFSFSPLIVSCKALQSYVRCAIRPRFGATHSDMPHIVMNSMCVRLRLNMTRLYNMENELVAERKKRGSANSFARHRKRMK